MAFVLYLSHIRFRIRPSFGSGRWLVVAACLGAALTVWAVPALSQDPPGEGGDDPAPLPAGCPGDALESVQRSEAVSPSQVREADALAGDAGEAAILGDHETAVRLLRAAGALNPGSASIAYRTARSLEEVGRTTEAQDEYCRYLALEETPSDRAEVEERIAVLHGDASPAGESPSPLGEEVAGSSPLPSAGHSPPLAFTLGLLVPGMGQVYVDRPGQGILVLAAAAGSAAAGVLTRRVEVTCLSPPRDGACPAGQVLERRRERPYLAHGLAVAGAAAFLGAVQAYRGARSADGASAEFGASLPPLEVEGRAGSARVTLEPAPLPNRTGRGGLIIHGSLRPSVGGW